MPNHDAASPAIGKFYFRLANAFPLVLDRLPLTVLTYFRCAPGR